MKTIGFIGGLTWHSSIDYYRLCNEMVNQRLGGVHSCKMLMYSVDFEEVKQLTFANNWPAIAAMMCDVAARLETAGADCLLLGANTMHNVADEVQAAVKIPLIHIASATALEILKQQINSVALLGTRYTMQMDFYKNKLAEKNITTVIPGNEDMEFINHCIYEEMGKGLFLPESKARVISIINGLKLQGAEGVILGCTELPILIKPEDIPIPSFDTTLIHVKAAVEFVLS
jgi:aspartate racemase